MHDVIIIGGSYAGIAAALQLARARRSVLVLDQGLRRNRFAGHSHGFLGQDGQPPGEIAARGRAEVLRYPTVTWKEVEATEAAPADGGVRVRAGSEEHLGRRLILATGISDVLPSIPGLAEHWGTRVFQCPYCDGYEFQQGRLGVISTGPPSAHFAALVSDWTTPGGLTLFLNGVQEPTDEELARFRSRQINIERVPVARVGGAGKDFRVELQDGRSVPVDGVFVQTPTKLNGSFAHQLGCELESGPRGPYYKTDGNKETSVPGVFACGDAALPMSSVSHAVSDGVRAGTAVHQTLIFRDIG